MTRESKITISKIPDGLSGLCHCVRKMRVWRCRWMPPNTSRSVKCKYWEVTSLKNTDGNINNGPENIKQLKYLSIQKLNQYRKSDSHNIVKEDYLIDRGKGGTRLNSFLKQVAPQELINKTKSLIDGHTCHTSSWAKRTEGLNRGSSRSIFNHFLESN